MNRNLIVRIATDPPARLWSGSGDLLLPADDVETEDGARYLGGGELLSGLDELEQLINGRADRIDINVSGVTAATVKLALQDADDIKGAAVDIGVVTFDDLWQIVDVEWQARYRADKLGIDRPEGQRSITLSMGSEDTGRSRTSNAYWTDAEQRRRSPTDRIFDRVSGINSGTSRDFGPNG
ncbi:hypothetical protein [Sphingomonas sp. Leaf10]|uniref:hypothetical protein n=1 Tax=Sphingomonas sp. Leaf10 TaxID=1735676 RepID=UPI0007018610|nr:hypothetical protein [Sphingomonas sp. Leaf10]KQM37930.1 hypothetical protein ASE59_11560 [Sphingomonas sp. Leaf10]